MKSSKKQPNERHPINIDFTNLLDVGETIASKTATAVDSAAVDKTSTVVHSSEIDGSKIVVVVKAGTDGESYKITIRATTSSGNVYEEDVLMEVNEE